nr:MULTISPECIES: aldehyde dehydrogenase family protein [unclassified Bradyrhizobium]
MKPGSQTQLSAVALAALAEKAGVPKSVFNVIAGDSGRSARFCACTRPRALSASPARRRSARSSTVGPASA